MLFLLATKVESAAELDHRAAAPCKEYLGKFAKIIKGNNIQHVLWHLVPLVGIGVDDDCLEKFLREGNEVGALARLPVQCQVDH